jgi:APA family basic amino acid/polyamine antiporter
MGDAVVIGLGSMVGAGVFAAVGPAAGAAGSWLLVGLVLAGMVAYANATSSAALAAVHPESGGAYAYGRRRLGPFWGFMAGWAFLAGKLASCAAMALTLGGYLAPGLARPVALGGLAAVTVANYLGVAKTAAATRVVVAVVLAALATAVAGMLLGGQADPANLTGPGPGVYGVLQAAGLLFFAFAGYARVATLGEEVVDPARTIPRAVPLALGIALAVYAVVCASALLAVGPAALAEAAAPLADAVAAGRLAGLEPVVRLGAAVASLGVLLSLQAGLSRTGFAMAANRDLPGSLAAVHPRYRVPHRAELAVAGLVAVAVLAVDLRGAIGFSSTLVLVYYAVANAAAWTLGPGERRWPRWLAGAGLAGCLLLAASLPVSSVLAGTAVLGVGAAVWVVRRSRRQPS